MCFVRIVTWNMAGTSNALAKWAFLKDLDADLAVLQETRLPPARLGHTTRRHIKPALNRDDVVIVAGKHLISRALPDEARGQALEIEIDGVRVFGLRSYPQVKEYYPRALLRIVDAIAGVIATTPSTPTVIAGDFNASLDQGPGRDWTPPFRRLHDLGFYDAFCLRNDCDRNSMPCRRNHGKTFRNSSGQYRIDHLYVNQPMADRLRAVRIGEEGWRLSDHRPIVADFE